MRTASRDPSSLVLGNRTRRGDFWYKSTTRVPFTDWPTTIRQEPFARCRSKSDEVSIRCVDVAIALVTLIGRASDVLSSMSNSSGFNCGCSTHYRALIALFYFSRNQAVAVRPHRRSGLERSEPCGVAKRPFTSYDRAGHQTPARPCGLLYGILTLVTSLSEPSGCVA